MSVIACDLRTRIPTMKMTFALMLVASTLFAADKKPFTVVEATIPEMQAALKSGRVTSRDLVSQYLMRIGMYEDRRR